MHISHQYSTFPSSFSLFSTTSTAATYFCTSSAGWPRLRIQSRVALRLVLYCSRPRWNGAALLCIHVLADILCTAPLPDPTGEIYRQEATCQGTYDFVYSEQSQVDGWKAFRFFPSEYWTTSRFGKNSESIGSATWCRERESPPKSASGTDNVFTLLNGLKNSRQCVLSTLSCNSEE
jgi:hypothetical protein